MMVLFDPHIYTLLCIFLRALFYPFLVLLGHVLAKKLTCQRNFAIFPYLGSGPDRGRSPVEWGDFPSIRPYVCPYVPPSVRPSPPSRAQEPARQALDPASQVSEPARQASEPLRPGWLALRPDWLGLRPAWLALGLSSGGMDGRTDGWLDGRMYRRTDRRKISPFYRTSSPIGAAAPLQPNFNPKTV